jgi:hypothetical protein
MSGRLPAPPLADGRETYTMTTQSKIVRISVRIELQDVPAEFDIEDAFHERIECARLLAEFAKMVGDSAYAALPQREGALQ